MKWKTVSYSKIKTEAEEDRSTLKLRQIKGGIQDKEPLTG